MKSDFELDLTEKVSVLPLSEQDKKRVVDIAFWAMEQVATIAPPFRGYAKLGAGGYFVFHTDKPDAAELVISLADEESCRTLKVGDTSPPLGTVQPEQMAVRIEFTCPEALDVLENQLRQLRAEHFGVEKDGGTSQ